MRLFWGMIFSSVPPDVTVVIATLLSAGAAMMVLPCTTREIQRDNNNETVMVRVGPNRRFGLCNYIVLKNIMSNLE